MRNTPCGLPNVPMTVHVDFHIPHSVFLILHSLLLTAATPQPPEDVHWYLSRTTGWAGLPLPQNARTVRASALVERRKEYIEAATCLALSHRRIVFRHLLRLILLIAEFRRIVPPDTSEEEWHGDLDDISAQLAACCRQVDPTSTDKTLEQAEAVSEVV